MEVQKLKELFYRLINEYGDESTAARAHDDFKRSFGNLVRYDIS